MSRNITINDIAKKLGVAPSTVSRAFDENSRISPKVRNKILSYAKECGYIPNRAAGRLSMRAIPIGVLIHDGYKQGYDEMIKGINNAFLQLYDYKLNIKAFVYNDEGFDDAFNLVKDCSGLIVCGTAEKNIKTINEYAEKGGKVAVLQSPCLEVNALFSSVIDSTNSAVMAAELLSCCTKKGGKRIALITGTLSSKVHSDAYNSFMDTAKKLGLEVVVNYDMQDDDENYEKFLSELLSKKVDGIYVTSGKSLPLLKAFKNSGQRPSIVTFDTYPELNGYLKDGTVTATVYQNLFMQGHDALYYLVKNIVEGVQVEKVISPMPQLVFASTIDLYSIKEQKLAINVKYIKGENL